MPLFCLLFSVVFAFTFSQIAGVGDGTYQNLFN